MENRNRELYKLESLDKYELEHKSQDLRGKTLITPEGEKVGRVDDMLVNTDSECVEALRLDDDRVIDVDHVDIRDGKPVLLVPHSKVPRPAADFDRNNVTSKHIPIIEERLEVGKREVETGRIRIRSHVVEKPVHKEVELRDERVDVERRPVNERIPANEARAMFKDRDVEVTARGEKAVVGKEAVVKEELVVGKETGRHTERIDDTVRHTEVDVDRDRGDRR